MKLFTSTLWLFIIGCALFAASTSHAAENTGVSKAQQLLTQAQQQNKFAFLLFYKTNDAPTQEIARTLNAGVASRQDRAVSTYVWLSDASEKAIIEKFGVGRSPMPMTVAVAPNGAITGVFSQQLADSSFDEAMVTPAMTRCIKAMQEGKLVVLCAQPSAVAAMPNAVQEFQTDPHFNTRLAVVSMQLADPAEARFARDLKIVNGASSTTMVFMAPPGVMVGTYDARATKAQMAADLHKAGRCCDDPHCKHNHQ